MRVAVQLPSTERLQHQFPSSATLSHILHYIGFESTPNTKINYLNIEVCKWKWEKLGGRKFEAVSTFGIGKTRKENRSRKDIRKVE